MPASCQVPDAKGDLLIVPEPRLQEALFSFYEGKKELGFRHQKDLM